MAHPGRSAQGKEVQYSVYACVFSCCACTVHTTVLTNSACLSPGGVSHHPGQRQRRRAARPCHRDRQLGQVPAWGLRAWGVPAPRVWGLHPQVPFSGALLARVLQALTQAPWLPCLRLGRPPPVDSMCTLTLAIAGVECPVLCRLTLRSVWQPGLHAQKAGNDMQVA